METSRTLSAAKVPNRTQPMNEPSRRTVYAAHEEDAVSEFRLLIGGKLVEGAGTLDVINPATGRALTTAPRADRAQLEQAVAAAKAAFPAWSATPLRVRADLLAKLADALEAEQDEFARLLTQEQGKPLPQAQWEIAQSIGTLRYFASLDLPPEVLKEDATQKVIRQHKPLGVVAAITPWNFPVILLMIKVAPALLAGQHGRGQAGPDHAADDAQVRRTLRPDPAAQASSTSSSTRTTWDRPSPATPTWPRSRSPAPPRPARR